MHSEALINYIETLPPQLIMQITHEGQSVWVKRRPDSKQTVWHKLQSTITRLVPVAILKTTASQGGPQSLKDEAQRIQQFAEHQIPVPNILALTDDFIALSDTGQQLKKAIDLSGYPQRFAYLKKAADALGRLHAAGLCHGRPALRDMTIQNDVIYFIDLEENPAALMPLAQAQARDAWLFFNGAARYAREHLEWLPELYRLYAQHAPADAIAELHRMARMLKPFRILMQYLIAPFAGKDVQQAVHANIMLEQQA